MAINLVKKSILFLLFVVSLSYSAFEDQNLSIDKPISKAAISESSSLNLLKCDHILDLPEPILREIFLNLQDNHLDIIRFAQTCKRANEIVQNAHIPLTIYASTYKDTGIFTPANARRIRTLVIGTELNSFPPSDVPNQYTWNDLLSHTQLRSLSITHHQLEATFFSNLFSQCPHLQSLVLNNCTVGEDVWENLARLLPSTGIRCLNLNLNHAGYPKKDTFIKILPHTQITTFKIPLTSSEKKVFMSVLPHTQISSLDIELREVEELTELANTLPDTKINNLTIRFSRYGSLRDNKKGGLFALSSFADGFSRTKITSITMRDVNDLFDNDRGVLDTYFADEREKEQIRYEKAFREMVINISLQHPFLKKLSLERSIYGIGAEGITPLVKSLSVSSLTSLDLQWNGLTKKEMRLLAPALPSSRIISLNLRGNIIMGQGLKALVDVLPSTQIEFLDVGKNGVGKTILELIRILPQTKIVRLGLSGWGGCKDCLPFWMQGFDYSGNYLEGAGMNLLCEALSKTEIRFLDLSGNDIGKEEMHALMASLPQAKIEELDINLNEFSKEHIALLSKILPKTRLKTLKLGYPADGRKDYKEVRNMVSQLTNPVRAITTGHGRIPNLGGLTNFFGGKILGWAYDLF